MNRRIFLAVFLLLFSGALFASESVVFQWRFRKLIQDDLADTYDVFLYESANDEEHHLLTLPRHLVPNVSGSGAYSKQGQESDSDVFSSILRKKRRRKNSPSQPNMKGKLWQMATLMAFSRL